MGTIVLRSTPNSLIEALLRNFYNDTGKNQRQTILPAKTIMETSQF